jgi:hypothetical protein
MTKEQACKDCRFWVKLPGVDATTGKCHHGPPGSHDWPQKAGDDWCGQFAAKDAPAATMSKEQILAAWAKALQGK